MNDTEILVVKLAHSFADVFCNVDSSEAESIVNMDFETVTLKSPMIAQIIQHPQKAEEYVVQMHVLCQFMDKDPSDQELTLRRDSILFATRPVDDMAKQYRSRLSKIVQANGSDLAALNLNSK